MAVVEDCGGNQTEGKGVIGTYSMPASLIIGMPTGPDGTAGVSAAYAAPAAGTLCLLAPPPIVLSMIVGSASAINGWYQ